MGLKTARSDPPGEPPTSYKKRTIVEVRFSTGQSISLLGVLTHHVRANITSTKECRGGGT